MSARPGAWARRARALLPALAGAGALAPLARAWLAGMTVLHRDQTGQYAPLRWLAGTALRSLDLPLWNPFVATGMPFLAETTHGVLHPLSVAVAFLFPSDGLDPLVGAWVLSAALGAFALARSLGASPLASLLAAFAYGLSGWTLSMTSNLINLAGAGSAPWVCAGLRVAGRDRSAAGLAAGAAAVAAAALGGDVQALAVAAAVGLVLALEAGGWRGAVLGLLAVTTGALLAGVQLVPSWSFLQHTDRVFALPAHEKDQWDLAPWRLVEALSPGFFTVPSDGMGPALVFVALGHPTFHSLPLAESVFVGGAVLLLAAAGVRAGRTGRVLLACAVVVLWLAMGRHLGARALQDLLPVASGWRYGEKYLTSAVLCLAALSALGLDRLLGDAAGARRWALGAWVAGGAVLAAWLALAAGVGAVLAGGGTATAEHVAAHLARGLPHAAVALAATGAGLWLAARGRAALSGAALVAVVWAAGAAASGYALRPGSPAARLHAEPPALRADPPGPRVLRVGPAPARPPPPGWDAIDAHNFEVAATYTPNLNARHRVDAFGADTGLQPLRWAALAEALGPRVPLAARRYAVTHLAVPPLDGPGAAFSAAVEGATAEVTDARTGMTFWAIPHRGWTGFPREVVAVPAPEAAIDAIVRLEREGRRATVVEAEGALPVAGGRILEVARGREEVRIVAEAEGDAVLVVNDAFWPGWQASVDGREVPILAADVLVRAVVFPAGRHTLVMRYEPPEVTRGLLVSAAGAVILAVACTVLRFRRRRRRAGFVEAEAGPDRVAAG